MRAELVFINHVIKNKQYINKTQKVIAFSFLIFIGRPLMFLYFGAKSHFV